MLKISNIESVEPRKSVVGVGDGGRNRTEPVGKYKVDGVDGVDDGGGCNGDRKFHPRFQYGSRATYLDAQNELIHGLIK